MTSAPSFTVDEFAKVAGIPLGAATLYVEDLVLLRLAEPADGANAYRLTPRGHSILRALRFLPVHEDAA